MTRLKQLRTDAELTQEQLAVRSGVKLSTVQKLESGSNSIMGARFETVLRLAEALDVKVEELARE